MDKRVSGRLLLMVQVILISPAKVEAFTSAATSWLRTTTSYPDITATVPFSTTTNTASEPTTATTTTTFETATGTALESTTTTTFETATGTPSESSTAAATTTAPTTGAMSFETSPSFSVTTVTSEGSSATDVTWLASSTSTSESSATTEKFNTPSTVNIDKPTVVICENSTEIEALEAKLAVATALAAVFGVTSAILLVLLLFLHRGSIILKWRELRSESQSESRNRNELQMDRQFNTNSHIYIDLRRDPQGENPGSSGNDAPVYINAGQASGHEVNPNTDRSTGTFRS